VDRRETGPNPSIFKNVCRLAVGSNLCYFLCCVVCCYYPRRRRYIVTLHINNTVPAIAKMPIDSEKALLDLDTPIEMTKEEYSDMIDQVAGLTESEASEEWLESCRFGELDIVRILLRKFPEIVEHSHPLTGNTGLHNAAANGHVEVAKVLLAFTHGFEKNLSGNTPLHHAAINSKQKMVELLTTQSYHEVDVLDQNDFGRSALTEGFTSQNEGVIKSILEHDSATEEKLLATDGKSASHVVHEFFDKSRPLRIRELAITNADNPFADTERPDQDTTGLSIWSAALVLARWTQQMNFSDSTVLELGAGCGVPGLAVAFSNPPPKRVYVTDLNPKTVENLDHNISLNGLVNTTAIKMDWCDKSTWPEEKLDFVIGSDLIYQKSLVPLLVDVVLGLLKPNGKFYYVAPESGRDGLVEFIDRMKEACSDWKMQIASQELHSNPLVSGDDEECFLHFQELSSLTYCLHEFMVSS
jgi:predicted nicotinamide N-methyase